MWNTEAGHLPVLLGPVVEAVAAVAGAVVVDATFGGGGYSRSLLAAGARVIGIDCDPEAVARGEALAAAEPRFRILHGRFGAMVDLLAGIGVERVDAIVMDVGVSSFQLDQAERGFSFRHAGPLDMRMSREGPTAADMLATASEGEIAGVLRAFGDEPDAKRIARAIVRRRETAPLRRTEELAELVAAAKGGRRGPTDPATRTFQALRIWVNDELGELDRALEAAEALLVDGGRLVVVAFHSGEDERVKRFVDERGGRPASGSRHAPPVAQAAPRWSWVSRKAVMPGPAETASNPRARSARMRVAVRRREADADDPADGWRLAA
ncbi:MAG: 16S rRNA (cytosine(1402)-N(4))-methyltransferase RsmH [Geminicoccaceae bacterium]